jgi:metal-sulfur cluster biosynthetic enzyme
MNVITNHRRNCSSVLAALEKVMDPEIGLNVVDLGLIYQIDFDEAGNKIFVLMTLTTQFCPMGESISGAAARVIEHTFPGYAVQLEITFNPHWNSTMISKEGKLFLNNGIC